MPKRIEAPLVNAKTGELINTSRLIELEDGDHVLIKKQEFLQKKESRYQDSTNFVWLSFQYGTNIDFHIEKAVAVRFLYFSTACGMDGIIQKNKLMTAKPAWIKISKQCPLSKQFALAYFDKMVPHFMFIHK